MPLFPAINSTPTATTRLITSSTTATAQDNIIADNRTTDITVTLPAIASGQTGSITICCIANAHKVYINLNGSTYNSSPAALLYLQSNLKTANLIYLDSNVGWIEINNFLVNAFVPYLSGMKLWIEGGSLIDKSPNNNNATALTAGSLPSVATGIDNKQVLRWAGSGNQELQITPFMASATAATVYCVFTVSANTNYNLIRTANLDDYWEFSTEGNGYIGTFLSARLTSYPASMPKTGNHLVSIHANSTTYEVLLDNISKGAVSAAFAVGDRFRIGTNDKLFTGDIANILVYPSYYSKISSQHSSIINTIKLNYPSLVLS